MKRRSVIMYRTSSCIVLLQLVCFMSYSTFTSVCFRVVLLWEHYYISFLHHLVYKSSWLLLAIDSLYLINLISTIRETRTPSHYACYGKIFVIIIDVYGLPGNLFTVTVNNSFYIQAGPAKSSSVRLPGAEVIVIYCIVLYCIVLYCIVLYCIVLCCIILYCIILYCIVLYWFSYHCKVYTVWRYFAFLLKAKLGITNGEKFICYMCYETHDTAEVSTCVRYYI